MRSTPRSKWSRVATYNQRIFILVVKSQSKYLAGQHFDRGRRSEYRIYRSVTPFTSHAEAAIYLAINDPSSANSGSEASNSYNLTRSAGGVVNLATTSKDLVRIVSRDLQFSNFRSFACLPRGLSCVLFKRRETLNYDRRRQWNTSRYW